MASDFPVDELYLPIEVEAAVLVHDGLSRERTRKGCVCVCVCRMRHIFVCGQPYVYYTHG